MFVGINGEVESDEISISILHYEKFIHNMEQMVKKEMKDFDGNERTIVNNVMELLKEQGIMLK
jgi:hypothetical protein